MFSFHFISVQLPFQEVLWVKISDKFDCCILNGHSICFYAGFIYFTTSYYGIIFSNGPVQNKLLQMTIRWRTLLLITAIIHWYLLARHTILLIHALYCLSYLTCSALFCWWKVFVFLTWAFWDLSCQSIGAWEESENVQNSSMVTKYQV